MKQPKYHVYNVLIIGRFIFLISGQSEGSNSHGFVSLCCAKHLLVPLAAYLTIASGIHPLIEISGKKRIRAFPKTKESVQATMRTKPHWNTSVGIISPVHS